MKKLLLLCLVLGGCAEYPTLVNNQDNAATVIIRAAYCGPFTVDDLDYSYVKNIEIRTVSGSFRPVSKTEFDSADTDKSGKLSVHEFTAFANTPNIVELRYKKCL